MGNSGADDSGQGTIEGSVADDSGPGTEESQFGDRPEVRYWMQGEDGLKVTAAGLASEEEVGEEVQHGGQEGVPGGQDQRVLSAEQCKSMLEAMRHESLTRQCQEKAPSGILVLTKELGDELEKTRVQTNPRTKKAMVGRVARKKKERVARRIRMKEYLPEW